MKTVFVLSGGTGTAWSICSALRAIAGNQFRLVVCDINPSYLVHTSVLADEFITVLPISAPGYRESMLKLFDQHHADVVIPLIDWDLQLFARDDQDLVSRGILSTAPHSDVFRALSDKEKLAETAKAAGVPTPRLFSVDQVQGQEEYFVKPAIGFGSRNARKMTGAQILESDMTGMIIQELCLPQEITVDISCVQGQVTCVCRERVETKAGVCTKARVFRNVAVEQDIRKIAEMVPLPECCCAQFMKGTSGELRYRPSKC